jgi:hypothetical protein
MKLKPNRKMSLRRAAVVVGGLPISANAPIDSARPNTRSERVSIRVRGIGLLLFLGRESTYQDDSAVCVIGQEFHREPLKVYFRGHNMIRMQIHFWPLLIGALILIWGITTLVAQALGITIPISWWAVVAIIAGLWILSHAIRRPQV